MIRTPAVVLALLLLPAAGFAQEEGGFGLDLSDDGQKKENEKKAPEEEIAPAPPSTPKGAAEAKTPARDDSDQGEREITQEDRVKSVQKKVYLKKGRFELAPFAFLSVNDPYYSKTGFSVRAGYFLSDSLAVALRGSIIRVVPSEDVRTAKGTFKSRIFYSVPQSAVAANLEWSPLYGKISIFNSILHADGHVVGGVGVVNAETSALPDRGLYPSAEIGAGMRIVAKDFLAVNVLLMNTTYVDQPTGTSKGATQNMLTLNAGISVFLPLKSTGRESE